MSLLFVYIASFTIIFQYICHESHPELIYIFKDISYLGTNETYTATTELCALKVEVAVPEAFIRSHNQPILHE